MQLLRLFSVLFLMAAPTTYSQSPAMSDNTTSAESTSVVLDASREMLTGDMTHNILNAICVGVAIVFGIFGNILIIVSIMTREKLKTPTNLLLAGIAVTDFLNSLVAVIHTYPYTILMYSMDEHLGKAGCIAFFTLKRFLQFVAINNLVAISFERYFAICWPLKKKLQFTPKKVIMVVVFNWLLAALEVTPYSVYLEQANYQFQMHRDCIPIPSANFKWEWYSLVMYFLLPVLIQCFTYGAVVVTLVVSLNKKLRQSLGNENAAVVAERTRLKIVYMLIALVLIYIASALPLWIEIERQMRNFFDTRLMSAKRGALFELIQSLHGSAKVIVYPIVSRQFWEVFKEILCCLERPTSPNTASIRA